MSTRAIYTFKDEHGEYHVYKHSDGYPSWALRFIEAATKNAWPLPRFEADEFAAAFVAANKEGCGGVRLTAGATWQDTAWADIQYRYLIQMRGKQLCVDAYAVSSSFGTRPWTEELLKSGPMDAMLAWSKTDDVA